MCSWQKHPGIATELYYKRHDVNFLHPLLSQVECPAYGVYISCGGSMYCHMVRDLF